MTRILSALIVTALAVAGFITCTSTPVPVADDDAMTQPEVAPPPRPAPHPFVDPPPLSKESWQLPDYGRAEPSFPWLPDEDREGSRSIGTVTAGYLVNSRPLPLPHPHMQILPRQFERSMQYSGDAMIELVDDAAYYVAEKYPDSPLYVGNFGRQGGGNIPHSVSHNNGRDADIAFFVLDEDGDPTKPPDLLSMDSRGKFIGASDSDDDHGEYEDLFLQFDAPRNWRFVEGLIESEAADIQYIFVSRPLQRLLLEEARRQGASAQTRQIARALLIQPGGNAQPHDDHFHIRIHCSPRDLAAGCRERGRAGPTFQADRSHAQATIEQARALLDDDDAELRRTAIRRLEVMDDRSSKEGIANLIDDPAPKVRIAAIRALRDHPPSSPLLITQLEHETDPQVLAELTDALVELNQDDSAPLIALLNSDHRVSLNPTDSIAVSALVADTLARLHNPAAVPELIAALEDAEPSARVSIAQALRSLTNHRFATNAEVRDDDHLNELVAQWSGWWDEHEDKEHEEWLIAGFRSADFNVESLDETDVWELCRAISDDHHLNFNAQRILKEISGQSPGSFQWHPHDASFYWRRWFERRQDDYSVPPIPTELSTADGYTQPP